MQPLPPDSYHLFPSLFSNCDFSTVKHLDMTLPHLPPTNLPAFSPLFSSFSSVGSLSTDEQTLSTILSTPTPTPPENAETADRITVFFPHLHTLGMRMFEERHPELDSNSGADTSHASVNVRPLLRFLRTRLAQIQTLDIGEISEWVDLDMTFIEEITGLLVTWYTNDEYFNYTCGSGKPESLLFTAPSVDVIRAR
ncbi:hypothetical protein GALMADRAFT_217441 [Galerina marginata CBS 339.88]|uniref:Uncharacterized protein n=1 Tax=Galerina marginata (strain CBS 339.88) TaxID=685588 RepID=A0A067SFZ6_GALM3|nr:hypothetical protein GALMADRAFT_217441 [Galerina marginata CBS 339.88]